MTVTKPFFLRRSRISLHKFRTWFDQQENVQVDQSTWKTFASKCVNRSIIPHLAVTTCKVLVWKLEAIGTICAWGHKAAARWPPSSRLAAMFETKRNEEMANQFELRINTSVFTRPLVLFLHISKWKRKKKKQNKTKQNKRETSVRQYWITSSGCRLNYN